MLVLLLSKRIDLIALKCLKKIPGWQHCSNVNKIILTSQFQDFVSSCTTSWEFFFCVKICIPSLCFHWCQDLGLKTVLIYSMVSCVFLCSSPWKTGIAAGLFTPWVISPLSLMSQDVNSSEFIIDFISTFTVTCQSGLASSSKKPRHWAGFARNVALWFSDSLAEPMLYL